MEQFPYTNYIPTFPFRQITIAKHEIFHSIIGTFVIFSLLYIMYLNRCIYFLYISGNKEEYIFVYVCIVKSNKVTNWNKLPVNSNKIIMLEVKEFNGLSPRPCSCEHLSCPYSRCTSLFYSGISYNKIKRHAFMDF